MQRTNFLSIARTLLLVSSTSAAFALACGSDESTSGDDGETAGASGETSGGSSGASGSGGSTSGGSAGSTGEGGSAGSGGSNTGGTATGGSGTGGSGGTAGSPPECARSCEQASDCANAGASAPFDADNWSCDGGHCRWLGCLNDDECAFFGGVCRRGFVAGGDVSTCTEGCETVDVCAENLAAVDIDNWTCEDGGCKYVGCLDDEECETDLGPGAKCLQGDAPYPSCVSPCSEPADCVSEGASASQDADNWDCVDGLCVASGCVSDDECTEAQGAPAECVPN
ncbi:MAG TPA: hypothetical protein VF103_07445 [Polyangiaceae bacterium]